MFHVKQSLSFKNSLIIKGFYLLTKLFFYVIFASLELFAQDRKAGFMGRHILPFTFLYMIFVSGCMLDRSGLAAATWTDAGGDAGFVPSDSGPIDAEMPDGGIDAGLTDAGDSGFDAGLDAAVSDSGADAGFDAGSDSGTDAGSDAGVPRVLTFWYSDPTRADQPIESWWVSERTSTASPWSAWRSVGCVGGITSSAAATWECEYDMALPTGGTRTSIRFYPAYNTSGVAPTCGASSCGMRGEHRIYIDSVRQPALDISEVTVTSPDPVPPAGSITVKFYTTPP